jgi:hypothetical protein
MNKEITSNQMCKEKSQQNLPHRLDTIMTYLYTTGRLKIMRHTQKIVGPLNSSQLNIPEHVIQLNKYLQCMKRDFDICLHLFRRTTR